MKRTNKNSISKKILSYIQNRKKVLSQVYLTNKEKFIWGFTYALFLIKKQYYLFPKRINTYIRNFIFRYEIFLITIVYFLLLSSIIIVLGKHNNLILLSKDAKDLFIGVGTLIGSSLAIVTTFALYTVQNASEKYPKDFFKLVANIKKYLIIFLISTAISIAFFVGALYYKAYFPEISHYAVPLTLYLVGTSFYFLFLLLYAIKEDVDPNKVMVKIYHEIEGNVEIFGKRVEEYAEILKSHPDNIKEGVSTESIKASLFLSPSLQIQLNKLQSQLSYLFDYHDFLMSRKEKSSALEVLSIIENTIIKYLKVREDSSVIMPIPETIFVYGSDSKKFLQTILERMNRLILEYVKENDAQEITKLIKIYRSWLIQSSKVSYIESNRNQNPIYEQINSNFNLLVKSMINIKSMEGLFQSLIFYNTSTALAIDKNYPYIITANLEIVKKISFYSVVERQEPIIKVVFDYHTQTIKKMLDSNTYSREIWLKKVLDQVNSSSLYVYAITKKNTMQDTLLVQQDVSKPYLKFAEEIVKLGEETDAKADSIIKDKIELNKLLHSTLRSFADSTKDPNYFLLTAFSEIIKRVTINLTNWLEKTDKNSAKSQLKSEIIANINLPFWFLPDEGQIKDNLAYNSIIDIVGYLSLHALTKNAEDIAKKGAKLLFNIVKKFLNKSFQSTKPLYNELELMELVVFIGILASKLNKTGLLNEIKSFIKDFDELYEETYFNFKKGELPEGETIYTTSPSADQLKKNIERIAREYDINNNRMYKDLDDTRSLLLDSVSKKDIENFVKKVWEKDDM